MYINISKVDFGRCYSGSGGGGEVVDLDYMTLSALGDGEITISIPAELSSKYATSFSYSKDKSTWTDTIVDNTAKTISIPIKIGDNVYLKGDALTWFDEELYGGLSINSTANIDASGNIMSLLYGENFTDKTTLPVGYNSNFSGLFSSNEHLINAKDLLLPAAELNYNCYYSMFDGCTSLTTAPKLPATTLADSCYENMFSTCSSLTAAPELPATALATHCYFSMFSDCTSLTTAPELLAATLAMSCYAYMFSGCTSLTVAPELPATTLAKSCYNCMFSGCTSLTTSPQLPATALVNSCYYRMFYECSSINNITMLATDISSTDCLTDWVSGVASTGTFTKSPEMTSLPTGVNGVPSGWKVKDYGAVDYSQEYMTLSALGDGEITISIHAELSSPQATSFSYSKDKSTWTDTIIDGTEHNISIPVTSGDNVYLKGDALSWFDEGYYRGLSINSTANIDASGNIMSLLYGDNFKDKTLFPEGSLNALKGLFGSNEHLINAKDLVLPATTLEESCYSEMFTNCTSLTTAPDLHATALAISCYANMFNGCTSLNTAPELPATTLQQSCYSGMFQNCTSLTTAPELPATGLNFGCYGSMFQGCTSLVTAPELPAATLANACYDYMFSGCTSLTTAPELPATTLADYCYSNMFQGCTSLTTSPALIATTLAEGCYYGMFNDCRQINNITMLATDISSTDCLTDWVNGVASTGTFTKAYNMTSLPIGTSGIPVGWTVVNYTDYMTLSALGDGEIVITIPAEINSTYATSLSYSKDKATWTDTIIDDTAQTITIPVTSGDNVYLKCIAKQLGRISASVNINSNADINASGNTMSLLYGDDYKDKSSFPDGSQNTLNGLFNGNNRLINAKELVLPATTLAFMCYSSMFSGCTSLTTAPELPATTLTDSCYREMFNGCTSLTAAPKLPATTLDDSCYYYMFNRCTSLTAAPKLPATTLKYECYAYMFYGCTSLTAAPELPATTLTSNCYYHMFERCTSLTAAPELPATTLTDSCYTSMFDGCTSLTTAPELPATTLTDSCYAYMFNNCSNLNSITMLATDISAPGCLATWVYGVASTGTFTKSPEMTSLPTGQEGIPEGWEVKDYIAAPDYSQEYFTITALGDGNITLKSLDRVMPQYLNSLSYSTDKNYWEDISVVTDFGIPVSSGENVYFKGTGTQTALNTGTALTINSDCNINVSGNIMSLLYGDDFIDTTTLPGGSQMTFVNLFNKNANLISAENLILPATTLTDRCYQNMFQNCTSLTTAPSVLPATTLAKYCYSRMFYGCSSLTSAPALPAATLVMYCYNSMFRGCTSLTTAPELHATTLVSNCYASMFFGCSSLNSITMIATNIPSPGCLNGWVSGVSSTGTFTKAAEMTTLQTGESGIPSGWTVVDYTAA